MSDASVVVFNLRALFNSGGNLIRCRPQSYEYPAKTISVGVSPV
jgi:hypothetical protein